MPNFVIGRLRKAIKDYGQGGDDHEDAPVRDKDEFFALLTDAIEQTNTFCAERDIAVNDALASTDVF